MEHVIYGQAFEDPEMVPAWPGCFTSEEAATQAALDAGATRINFTAFSSPGDEETWSRVIATRPGGTSHGGWEVVFEAIVQPPVRDGWREIGFPHTRP